MNDPTDLFAFPELPDEAVVALNQFLEAFYTDFQNHYFAQMHRWYHTIDQRHPDQLPLPLNDPPF
jgi:Ulp1 family protease